MEFEKNAPISDEERRLANVKKITLQPSKVNIIPEDISESEIAINHINGQPLSSLHDTLGREVLVLPSSDDTTSSNTPSTSKQSVKMILIIVSVAVMLIVLSLFFVFAIIS